MRIVGVILLSMTAAASPAWCQFLWPNYPNNSAISITPGGNVGIGTTGPQAPLEVLGPSGVSSFTGSARLGLSLRGTDTAGYTGLDFTVGANVPFGRVGMKYTSGGSFLQFGTSNYYQSGVTNTAMSIDPNGNVGIGTTNPAYPLDVVNTSIVALRLNGTSGNPSSNNTQLRFAGGKSGELWAIGTDVAANNGSKDFHFYALPNAGNVVAMTFQATTGNVGIGTTNPCATLAPVNCKLSVAGAIQAQEVVVNTGWSDYVFRPAYRLKPLSEVAAYINQHGHLPDIPSETEVKEKGIGVGEMESKLLAKIEELTLHMIRVDEDNRQLREEVQKLKTENQDIRERTSRIR
jgi:hypothetical protein